MFPACSWMSPTDYQRASTGTERTSVMKIELTIPSRHGHKGGHVSKRKQDMEFDTNWASLVQFGLTKKRHATSRAPATLKIFCVLLRKASAALKREGKDPSLANLLAGKHANAIRGGVGACCDQAAYFNGRALPFPMAPNHTLAGVVKQVFQKPWEVCPDVPKATGAFEVRFARPELKAAA